MAFTWRLRAFTVVLAVVLAAFVALLGSGQRAESQTYPGPSAAGKEFAPGQLIVKLKEQAEQSDLREINQENDAATEENLPQSNVNVVDLPPDLTVREADEIYEDHPEIAYAEPDFELEPSATPNDTYYSRMWGLNNAGQTGGTPDADIDAPEAWNTTTGKSSTVVAVIDEGVDVSHPDLRDNVWVNQDEVPANGIDDDNNGYVDDVNGYDFANDDASVYDPDPVVGEGDEHGTHVAGTIAASGDNGVGVTGVNWNARIMALKFLDVDGGYTSDAVEAINYAVNNGVKISNNSWGGVGNSQSLRDAIARADAAGHLFVAAAGNGGPDGIGDDNDASPNYPASYDLPNVVSVAATNNRDNLTSFSNYGAASVDLAAPGAGILSTLPGNSYGYFSGTSMVTPHVSGVAALLASQNAGLDDAKLKSRLLQSVDQKPSLRGKTVTGGRLNAEAALALNAPADAASPSIISPRPAPRSTTTDRAPNIRATVRDDQTDLRKSDIRLLVDGAGVTTFSYDASTDRLSYTPERLAYGKHWVRVVAVDEAGNTDARRWSFTVAR